MKTYDLYLESGPKMRKTMVHVPALAGCTARGDTTNAALATTPAAIRAYLRFLARCGERAGMWLANGSAFLEPDLQPLPPAESDRLMERLGHLHDALRQLACGLTAKQLDAKPEAGRPIRRILHHVCGEGAYLRRISGASPIQREVDEGRLDPHDALDRLLEIETARLRSMTAAERFRVIMRGQAQWTARSAVRRMLEHAWEHYGEIAERLNVEP